jgi:hypothetical protein
VDEGNFHDIPALQAFSADLRALQSNPTDAPLLWKHGLGLGLRSEVTRLLEISNWLQAQVRPRAAHRV